MDEDNLADNKYENDVNEVITLIPNVTLYKFQNETGHKLKVSPAWQLVHKGTQFIQQYQENNIS